VAASGADVLLEVLETEHVRHVFGNPGTTELPLIDALAGQDRLKYVLALHESVAAGMADGYAQATGRPSFLNVHTATGLGNAMGNLSNSRATGTPMVVTAGQQDRHHPPEGLSRAGDRPVQSKVCSVSPDISYMRRICRATPIRSPAAASSVNPPSIRSSLVTR
jgi:thiamine pyrophosphate-dependent acetolactate synthase large subunit-like protein